MNIIQVGARVSDDRRDGRARALVLHTMVGTLFGCDVWFNDAGNVDGVAAQFGCGDGGEQHQYVSAERSARAQGIRDGAAPPDHGYAADFLASIGPIASPNRWATSFEHQDNGSPGNWTEACVRASVELAVMLWCPGGRCAWCLAGEPPPDGHGVHADLEISRKTILRHGEIGGHPYCPSVPEEVMTAYVWAVHSAIAGTPAAPVTSVPVAQTEDDMPIEMKGLDQSETVAIVAPFVAQIGDLVADRNGDAAYVILSGLPIEMKPSKNYILLELEKPV